MKLSLTSYILQEVGSPMLWPSSWVIRSLTQVLGSLHLLGVGAEPAVL